MGASESATLAIELAAEVARWRDLAAQAQATKRRLRAKLSDTIKAAKKSEEYHWAEHVDLDGIRYDYGPKQGQSVRQAVREFRRGQDDRIRELQKTVRTLTGDTSFLRSLRSILEAIESHGEG